MLCESCNTSIDARFAYAIKNNQCPACGQPIMSAVKLSSFLSLKELLSKHHPGIDSDAVSSLIVANFDIKQSFKNDLPNEEKKGIMKQEEKKGIVKQKIPVNEEITEVVLEDDESGPIGPVVHDGIMYEKVDKDKAKVMLQKMRDEALNDALDGRDDLVDEAEMLMSGDETLKQEYLLKRKREASLSKIKSGTGSFSRS
jgi:hypothetical protein